VTEAPTWLSAAGLPESEQTFDRHRRAVRDAAVARTAAALRDLTLDKLLTDRELLTLAGVAADAALRMSAEHADLLGSQGRLVARQWDTIAALRGELERRSLHQEEGSHT
jgi:hypothetical protein